MADKPKPKAKRPAGKSLASRLAADPALVKKYQSNPGLRSKYLTGALEKYLTPGQRQARAVNVRLNAPIAPGSSITERDLAHEAQAATTVQYGPQDRAISQQLGVAQQTERDTGQLYDQYRAALAQHQAAIQGYQAGAQTALQQTAAGITGLGQQQAMDMQQQANAAAAQQGVAPAGDISALANAALATRQGVMGTFQGQQALQGTAANSYADALTNVVAPGQKLTALSQARGRTRDIQTKQEDLAREKGAFNQTFRQNRRSDEFKNQLAVQTLGANVAQDQAQAATAASRVTESVRHNRTQEQIAKDRNKTAAKTAEQKAALAAGKVNQYGYTDAAWRALSTGARQKIIKDFKASSGGGSTSSTTAKKEFRSKYGVDLQPTSAHNRAVDFVQNAQTAFGQVGKVVKQADGKPHRVTTDDVVSHLRDKGVSNLWIRAGLEMARGGLTPGTAARIHKAGYSVSQLGFKMRSGRSSTSSRGSNIPAGKV